MIDYIKGSIAELTPASATIDNQGIGYFINISLNTYSVLNGKKEAKLYIHEAIREDAFQLFGFSEKHERELFAFLISVSGVGAGTARVMLSSMTPRELETAIASGNTDILKSVKGIGLKTAQRIIIDLKDKIKQTDALGQIIPVDNQRAEESVAALTMLGFAQAASQKVVYKILKEKPDCRTEEVLKMALKML